MSNVIYTNFGNIGQIQPAVITYLIKRSEMQHKTQCNNQGHQP